MQSEMAGVAGPDFPPTERHRHQVRHGQERQGRDDRVEPRQSYLALLYSPDRDVRATPSTSITSNTRPTRTRWRPRWRASIERDMYYAKARNYKSALEAALFPDQVPVSVYDNLIASIHRQLPALHHYYDVRRRKMGLEGNSPLRHLRAHPGKIDSRHTWDEAVDVDPGRPGAAGQRVLRRDRRRASATAGATATRTAASRAAPSRPAPTTATLTSSSTTSPTCSTPSSRWPTRAATRCTATSRARISPMPTTSTRLSSPKWPAPSTKRCSSRYLLKHARDKHERASLLNREIDAIRQTIFRQTMFAEFEKLAHASAEAGEPLTLDRIKEIYHGLLQALLRPRLHARSRIGPGVPPRAALLPDVLRLQVRHGHVGGDRAGRSRARRRRAGTERLSRLPQGRLLERPARPAARRRRRYGKARPRRSRARPLRPRWSRNWTRSNPDQE